MVAQEAQVAFLDQEIAKFELQQYSATINRRIANEHPLLADAAREAMRASADVQIKTLEGTLEVLRAARSELMAESNGDASLP